MWDWTWCAIWAFTLRFAQALSLAAPTLLVGVVTAGLVRGLLGPPGVARLFGNDRWTPLRAWTLATVLPVDAFGAIPVLHELHRAGAPRVGLLVFALSAAICNPFSLIYGITLITPGALAGYVLGTAVIAIAAALVASAWEREATSAGAPTREKGEPTNQRRGLPLVLLGSADALAGPAGADVLVGLAGVGLLGAVLPAGAMMTSMTSGDRSAPLTVLPIALLAAITPERGVMLVSEMFEHTCSTGAAFSLLLLGCGLNLGVLSSALRTIGPRTTAVWLATVLLLTLPVSYGIDFGYVVTGAESGHTHVFDNFSSPFPGSRYPDAPGLVLDKLQTSTNPTALGLLGGLAALTAIGLFLKSKFGRGLRDRVESWAPTTLASDSRWSRPLPARAVTIVLSALVLAVFVGGFYVYYPAPAEVLADMSIIRADALTAVSSRTETAALHHLKQWDTLASKLALGTWARQGWLSEDMRSSARGLREAIDDLANAIARKADPETTKAHVKLVETAYQRCKESYGGAPRQHPPRDPK